MKNTLISLLLLLVAFTSCDKEDTPVPPEDAPVKYISFCTIADDGHEGYILHSDGAPLYIKFVMGTSPFLKQIVESGTRRVYSVFTMPKSFDRTIIDKTDTIAVAGATITQIIGIDTHIILTSGEAELEGITSPDMAIETTEISASARRGFVTVTGSYGHLVSNEGILPVTVYLYVDDVHCTDDVLALRLVYTRNSIDGFDKIMYQNDIDCFALKPLKERYGSKEKVKIELRTHNQVITTLNVNGSDFASPID